MSAHNSSFYRVTDITQSDVQSLFKIAKKIKESQNFSIPGKLLNTQLNQKIIALMFLENSTRTRLSFEAAAKKIGLQTILLQNDNTSSLSKGESLIDTVETVLAMKPSALVIRHSSAELGNYLKENVNIPVINAGEGSLSHPTQALLDAFTLQESLDSLEAKKIVIVGDVLHSRVANSNKALLSSMGMDVAVCCPKEMFPGESPSWKSVKHFNNLEDAIAWSDAVMVLRVQKERHNSFSFNESDYIKKFRFEDRHINLMREGQFLLHPGPYVPGVDMQPEVVTDNKSLIRAQVENGVYIRAALLLRIMEESCRT